MNLFFPITAVFIWAANAVVSKLATGAIEPGAIAFLSLAFRFIYLASVLCKTGGAAQATLFMNLVPIFTVLISLLFLGQSPTVYHLIGGGFVFIGLLLAQVKIVPCRVNFNPDVIK